MFIKLIVNNEQYFIFNMNQLHIILLLILENDNFKEYFSNHLGIL